MRFDLSLILLLFFCTLNFLFYFIRNLCLLWGLRDTNFLNIGLEIFRHTQLQLLYWWLFFLILFGHYIFCYFYSFTFTLIPFVFYLNFALGWNLFWFALSNTFLLGSWILFNNLRQNGFNFFIDCLGLHLNRLLRLFSLNLLLLLSIWDLLLFEEWYLVIDSFFLRHRLNNDILDNILFHNFLLNLRFVYFQFGSFGLLHSLRGFLFLGVRQLYLWFLLFIFYDILMGYVCFYVHRSVFFSFFDDSCFFFGLFFLLLNEHWLLFYLDWYLFLKQLFFTLILNQCLGNNGSNLFLHLFLLLLDSLLNNFLLKLRRHNFLFLSLYHVI